MDNHKSYSYSASLHQILTFLHNFAAIIAFNCAHTLAPWIIAGCRGCRLLLLQLLCFGMGLLFKSLSCQENIKRKTFPVHEKCLIGT